MKWVHKKEHKLRDVTLPNQFTPGLWSPAMVGNIPLEVCWEPALRTLFARESATSPEVPLKYRTASSQRHAGEIFYEVSLEYGGGPSSSIQLLQSEWAIHSPGQNLRPAGTRTAGESIRSPMVGKVLKVLVTPGQTIERGHELVIIEAMKMENKIVARQAGIVKEVQINPGTQVSVGQLLIQIGPLP